MVYEAAVMRWVMVDLSLTPPPPPSVRARSQIVFPFVRTWFRVLAGFWGLHDPCGVQIRIRIKSEILQDKLKSNCKLSPTAMPSIKSLLVTLLVAISMVSTGINASPIPVPVPRAVAGGPDPLAGLYYGLKPRCTSFALQDIPVMSR